MKSNYFFRKASDGKYFNFKEKRIELREYSEDIVYYNSFTSIKSDFYAFDSIPSFGKHIIRDHGRFGNQIIVQSDIVYKKENFEALKDIGTISFYLGIQSITGYSKQSLTLKEGEKITAGTYSFSLLVGREVLKPVIIELSENASISEIKNAIALELDPDIFKAELYYSGLDEITIRPIYKGEEVEILKGQIGYDLLSICDVSPLYFGCYPERDQNILTVNEGSERIEFWHKNINDISILEIDLFYDDEIKTTLKSTLNNNGNVLTNVELGFDYDVAYLFIDGKLEDFKKTGFHREKNGELVFKGTETNAYQFDEFIIYNKLKHSASFVPRDSALTKYTTSNPFVDFFWRGQEIESLNGLNIDGENIHFVMYANDDAYYYFAGSWRSSDGTYSQSTDLPTLLTKIENFDKSYDEIRVRVIFNSDGFDQSWIGNIYFTDDNNDDKNSDLFGTEDETAAVLVGIPHLDNPIDLYGKKLVITTDKGTTEIEFEGELSYDVEKCNECINNKNITITKEDPLEKFYLAISCFKNVYYEANFEIDRLIKIKENLIMRNDASIIFVESGNMVGEDTAKILLEAGSVITGNDISITEEGEYFYEDEWKIFTEDTLVSTNEDDLRDFLYEKGSVALTNSSITISSLFALNENQQLNIGKNAVLTIDAPFTTEENSTINVYGTLIINETGIGNINGTLNVTGVFENNSDSFPWLNGEGNGKIITYSDSTVVEKGNSFIGYNASLKVINGSLTLKNQSLDLAGLAEANDLYLKDIFTVAEGSTLTIKEDKTVYLVPQEEFHSGGDLVGNVILKDGAQIVNL
jgi:hypothetical protein